MEQSQNFLKFVEELMLQGYTEELACRIAMAELYPEKYNADDYDDVERRDV